MGLIIIAIAILIAQLPPPPYAPPDLAGCSMAHGFVIGEAPEFPGSVEIWKCPEQTLVTLNQMQGVFPDAKPVTRSHFSPEASPGEQLMGCRGHDENYDGTVAITVNAAGAKPQLRRAWKADIEKWQFVSTPTTNLICNRGLTVK